MPCGCLGMLRFGLCWRIDGKNNGYRKMDFGGRELEFVKKVVEVAQAETIVGGIEEKEADLQVLGWMGRGFELSG